jgi:HlyD family secretion protein
MMNQSTKTFTVTAKFLEQPEVLYPNMNFEASIVIQTKEDALLIPRNYLITGFIGDKIEWRYRCS